MQFLLLKLGYIKEMKEFAKVRNCALVMEKTEIKRLKKGQSSRSKTRSLSTETKPESLMDPESRSMAKTEEEKSDNEAKKS